MASKDSSISAANGTLGNINRHFWNENMHIISNQQWVQDLLKQIVQCLQQNLHWVGILDAAESSQENKRSMLDYACGNGLVSYALLPWFSKVRGIDISYAVVCNYNKMANEQGIPSEVIHAIQGDIRLPGPEISSADFSEFDVVVICMALHHIDEPENLLSQLLARLQPGGRLLVIDWTPEHYGIESKVSEHPANQTVNVDGFGEEAMLKLMDSAGFEDTHFYLYEERMSMGAEIGGERQMFFARGQKPAINSAKVGILST
ncbi:hypothetical protein FSARC_11154 [Fusarium sarcochroum]|uniref:Methyltransferase n=1 Tax=Fusarium sarcochroum TaxID=1208366 RepID=A0A8H4X0R0_9HYPO|nr:hypothetical protein FSARC_11154 [Fusarium sarcochroum]